MDIPILFEDSEIVVIDKPSGIVCNRARTITQPTIQDWLAEKLQIPIINLPAQTGNQTNFNNQIPSDKEYFLQRSGLVHRLDRETSGVMVLAKTPEAFVELLRQFKERVVQKEYLALTHGMWQTREGEISLPIGRRRDDRKKMGVQPDGRESITSYKVMSEYKTWELPKELKVDDRGYTGFSLVSFAPKTGRTHQIRVHARHVGHPLVGDMDYAGRKRSREDRKWCKRVMLQAQKLSFEHPRNGKRISFEAKNQEIQQLLQFFTI
jgi:23S rRNA pseudouridine1911/1915/1917 synthase